MGSPAISPQIVRDFALKVATPGSRAMFLDEYNRNTGFASIAEAASSGWPFCVDVRPTILALDCDDPALQPELEKVEAELRAEGFEPVLVLSGGTGRQHLFCLITDPRAMRAYRDRVRGLGFGPRLEVRQKIRPPLSPHRHGLPVGLLRPDDPAEALAALTPRRPKALKPEWQRFIKVGAPEGERSGKIQGLALAAVNAGWGFGDFYTVMTDPENRCGEKLRSRRDTLRYLERVWESAMAFSAYHPAVKDREEAVALVAKLRARANTWHWPGRDRDRRWGPTGQTDRQVLEAHFTIVERTGKIVHAASVREIAELAGVEIGSVVPAHRRLRHEGWLKLVQGASGWAADAAIWRITGPTATAIRANVLWRQFVPGGRIVLPSLNTHNQGASGECSEKEASGTGGSKQPMAHDAWSRKGLGKRAGGVYAMLDPAIPRTTASLAAHMGVGRAAVWKHLARLRTHGLAVQDTKGGWLRGGADLDAVAVKLGVAGHADAKRREHQRQRERFRDHLDRGAPGPQERATLSVQAATRQGVCGRSSVVRRSLALSAFPAVR